MPSSFKKSVYVGDEVVDASNTPVTLAVGMNIRPAGCRSDSCAVVYDGKSSIQMDQMQVTFRLLPGSHLVGWAAAHCRRFCLCIHSCCGPKRRPVPNIWWTARNLMKLPTMQRFSGGENPVLLTLLIWRISGCLSLNTFGARSLRPNWQLMPELPALRSAGARMSSRNGCLETISRWRRTPIISAPEKGCQNSPTHLPLRSGPGDCCQRFDRRYL